MKNKYIWIRLGENGTYEEFGQDFSALAEHLVDFGITQISRWFTRDCGHGFVTPEFNGRDYVSCYWGDNDAQFEADLSEKDKILVENAVAETRVTYLSVKKGS